MADVRVTVVASASIVDGNDAVTLDATVVNPDGETLTYRWIAFPAVGVFANDQAVDTTWTSPVQDHEQVVTLALTAFYGTQATGTPFRFGFSGLGSTHVLGGNGAVGTAGVTVRASTVAESQTLEAVGHCRPAHAHATPIPEPAEAHDDGQPAHANANGNRADRRIDGPDAGSRGNAIRPNGGCARPLCGSVDADAIRNGAAGYSHGVGARRRRQRPDCTDADGSSDATDAHGC